LKEENIAWQRNCINIIGKGDKRRVIPMGNEVRFYLTKCFSNDIKIPLAMLTIQKYVKVVAKRDRIHKKHKPDESSCHQLKNQSKVLVWSIPSLVY
jgi:site-specific recombinase XerC